MFNKKYSQAFVQVLECLKLLNKAEYNKIPTEFIAYLNNNKDSNYVFKLDPNKSIAEQPLSNEANAINLYIYMKFFSTETINKKINTILAKNEQIYQETLKQKYNAENLFKNKKIKRS